MAIPFSNRLLTAVASRLRLQAPSCHNYYIAKRRLTSQELSTAMRPFYFSVHPDLFWQHPREKEINENSLKQLKSYLESLLSSSRPSAPTYLVTFYVKRGKESNSSQEKLKAVNVKLTGNNLHETVHGILTAFQLSTEYLDGLNPPPENKILDKLEQDFKHARRAEEQLRNVEVKRLSQWLSERSDEARERAESCRPVREDVCRLSYYLMDTLRLKDIIWDCGWGVSHFRGCLLSFQSLLQHYPFVAHNLKGRTIVFGQRTGVSLDGHIVLSSGDVKHCWLDLLQSIDSFEDLLAQVPYVENSLSEVLRGICIDHRKFQPIVMVQKYLQQLGKLISALYKFRWQKGYPPNWPRRLDRYQLVVECEAGPLMLSPTGQFIVPASCPAFLLVDFISRHMQDAEMRLSQYQNEKELEDDLYNHCRTILGLASLQKDDNVTPDLMIRCCERLLANSHLWSPLLRGTHLRVSNFYSILHDGEVCIPWDWKD